MEIVGMRSVKIYKRLGFLLLLPANVGLLSPIAIRYYTGSSHTEQHRLHTEA